MACNEGRVLISRTTSLALGLIKPHASLDHLPPGSNIISSSADQPISEKSQLNFHMLETKSKTSKVIISAKKISDVCSNQEQSLNKCSRKEPSHLIPKSKDYYVNQMCSTRK